MRRMRSWCGSGQLGGGAADGEAARCIERWRSGCGGWRVELAGAAGRWSSRAAAAGARLGRRAGAAVVVAVAGGRCAGGAAVAALAAATGSAARGCGGRGSARWSTRAVGRARCGAPRVRVGRAGRRPATCCGCGCGAAHRSPSWRLGASSWRRACACARSGCCAIARTAALAQRDARAARPVRGRAPRCRGRSADAAELSLWEPMPVGVDEHGEPVRDRAGGAQRADRRRAGRRASRSRCRCWSRRRRSIRTRGCGCWTASWSSWRCGRRSPSGSSARTASEAIALLRELREEMDDALPRAARARAAQGPPRGRAAAAPGGVRRAGVLPHAAGQAAAPGVRRAAARPRGARSRGRRDRRARRRRSPAPTSCRPRCATCSGSGWRCAATRRRRRTRSSGRAGRSAGADASTIPGGQRGVGYLLAEGERPDADQGLLPRRRRRARRSPSAPRARRADAWLATAGRVEGVRP